MPALVSSDELRRANKFRRLWSVYEQNADLIQVGAYEAGSNPELDEAIRLRESMVHFLRQEMHANEDYNASRLTLQHILS
jgi:flagellum-specific ATP synthase